MSLRHPPESVMNLAELEVQAAERRAGFDAIESDDGWVNEFGLFGAWVGSRWTQERYFVWMVGVDLVNSRDGFTEHAEYLVRRRRWHSEWEVLQPPERALDSAEDFVQRRLARGM